MIDERASDDSLYARLGGEPVLNIVVPHFYARALTDPALGHYFAGVDVGSLACFHARFLRALLGGASTYGGPSMSEVHHALLITDADFERAVNHLRIALTSQAVAPHVVAAISERVQALSPHIVAPSTAGAGGQVASG